MHIYAGAFMYIFYVYFYIHIKYKMRNQSDQFMFFHFLGIAQNITLDSSRIFLEQNIKSLRVGYKIYPLSELKYFKYKALKDKFLVMNINLNLFHKKSSTKRQHVSQHTGTRACTQGIHGLDECTCLLPSPQAKHLLPSPLTKSLEIAGISLRISLLIYRESHK